MEFDVPPQPLRQRGWRRAAVVAAGSIAIFVFALVLADTPATPPDGTPATPPEGTPAARVLVPATQASPLPTQVARATGTPIIQPSPPAKDAIRCAGLDEATCAQVAGASIATLTIADGPVTLVSVSRSLLCNDAGACPASMLARGRPLGSAVVTLGSGAQAWVNVVGPAPAAGRAREPARTTAWIVRWLP